MEEERVIQEFLGARPRAEQIGEWLLALRQRLSDLREDARRQESVGGAGVGSLQVKINQLEKQVRALEEEAAITEFVEDSVRVTLAMGATDGTGDED